MSARIASTLLALLLTATFALPASASSTVQQSLPVDVLIEQMLVASGLEGEELADANRRVSNEVRTLASKFREGPPNYRRARRLHEILHRRYLRHYDPDADGIQTILADGRYNCQAATFFMGLVARAIGIEAEVLESPGHLKLRLILNRRSVQVETTSTSGFDVDPHHIDEDRRPRVEEESSRRLGVQSAPTTSGDSSDDYWTVSLEQAVGFAWLNTAWRALDDGRPLHAANSVVEAGRYLPDLERATGVRRLLARAFSLEYDAARFENAYDIALIGIRLFPGSVYAHDRVVAVVLKLVEDRCDGDDPWFAEAKLEEVAPLAPSTAESLDRQTSPMIAAAAVRLEDWELAWRAARRYAGSEPDEREVLRLVSWIESRSLESAGTMHGAECLDSRPEDGPARF